MGVLPNAAPVIRNIYESPAARGYGNGGGVTTVGCANGTVGMIAKERVNRPWPDCIYIWRDNKKGADMPTSNGAIPATRGVNI